jgi:hypothetical protein
MMTGVNVGIDVEREREIIAVPCASGSVGSFRFVC